MEYFESQLNDLFACKRFDAQFFSPKYEFLEKIFRSQKTHKLSDISSISDGNHLKIAEEFDQTKGVRYLRGQDLSKKMTITDLSIVKIAESSYNNLQRSHVFNGDVLLSIVGTIGNVGLVYKYDEKLTANCKIAILRPKNRLITSEYLYGYLSSRIAQNQIQKSVRGSVQTGLVLPDIADFKILRADEAFEHMIASKVSDAHELLKSCKSTYQSAINLVEEVIGGFKSLENEELCFEVDLDNLLKNNRFDPEYYKPKFNSFFNELEMKGITFKRLKDLVTLKKGVEIGSSNYQETGIPFIRVSNISNIEYDFEKFMSNELYKDNIALQPKKDEIFFSKDGSPGIAYHFRDNPPECICSNGILILTKKDPTVKMDVLSLFLNSYITKAQLERDAGGSIISHWRPDQIGDLLIPELDVALLTTLSKKLEQSFLEKEKGESLLREVSKQIDTKFGFHRI